MFGRNKKKIAKRKAELGFLVLNLIAEIDGFFHSNENKIILDFISTKFDTENETPSLQPSVALIENTPKNQYYDLLTESCKEFYSIATPNESDELLLFALQLVNADNKIAETESASLRILNEELIAKKN